MAQILLDTVDFSTGYTAGHNLSTDDPTHWVDLAATFNPGIVSNPKGGVASNSGGGSVRTGFTWTDDQWVQAKMVVVPSSYGMVGVRFQTAQANGYAAGANPGGFNRYRIFRYAAGTATSLAVSTRDPTAGDVLNFQIVGSALTLLIYDSTMTLQETVGPATDATYGPGTGTGPAVFVAHSDSTSIVMSTWTAGSVGTVAAPTAPMFRGS